MDVIIENEMIFPVQKQMNDFPQHINKRNFIKLKPASVRLKRLRWNDVAKKYGRKYNLVRPNISRICRQLLNYELKKKRNGSRCIEDEVQKVSTHRPTLVNSSIQMKFLNCTDSEPKSGVGNAGKLHLKSQSIESKVKNDADSETDQFLGFKNSSRPPSLTLTLEKVKNDADSETDQFLGFKNSSSPPSLTSFIKLKAFKMKDSNLFADSMQYTVYNFKLAQLLRFTDTEVSLLYHHFNEAICIVKASSHLRTSPCDSKVLSSLQIFQDRLGTSVSRAANVMEKKIDNSLSSKSILLENHNGNVSRNEVNSDSSLRANNFLSPVAQSDTSKSMIRSSEFPLPILNSRLDSGIIPPRPILQDKFHNSKPNTVLKFELNASPILLNCVSKCSDGIKIKTMCIKRKARKFENNCYKKLKSEPELAKENHFLHTAEIPAVKSLEINKSTKCGEPVCKPLQLVSKSKLPAESPDSTSESSDSDDSDSDSASSDWTGTESDSSVSTLGTVSDDDLTNYFECKFHIPNLPIDLWDEKIHNYSTQREQLKCETYVVMAMLKAADVTTTFCYFNKINFQLGLKLKEILSVMHNDYRGYHRRDLPGEKAYIHEMLKVPHFLTIADPLSHSLFYEIIKRDQRVTHSLLHVIQNALPSARQSDVKPSYPFNIAPVMNNNVIGANMPTCGLSAQNVPQYLAILKPLPPTQTALVPILPDSNRLLLIPVSNTGSIGGIQQPLYQTPRLMPILITSPAPATSTAPIFQQAFAPTINPAAMVPMFPQSLALVDNPKPSEQFNMPENFMELDLTENGISSSQNTNSNIVPQYSYSEPCSFYDKGMVHCGKADLYSLLHTVLQYIKIFISLGFGKGIDILNIAYQMMYANHKVCCKDHVFNFFKNPTFLSRVLANVGFQISSEYIEIPIPSAPLFLNTNGYLYSDVIVLKRLVFAVDKITRQVLYPIPTSSIRNFHHSIDKISIIFFISPNKGLGPGLIVLPHSVLNRVLLSCLESSTRLGQNWMLGCHQKGGLTQSMLLEFMDQVSPWVFSSSNPEITDFMCFIVDWWWCLEDTPLNPVYNRMKLIRMETMYPIYQDPIYVCLDLTIERMWGYLVRKYRKHSDRPLLEEDFGHFIIKALSDLCSPYRLRMWCKNSGLFPWHPTVAELFRNQYIPRLHGSHLLGLQV